VARFDKGKFDWRCRQSALNVARFPA
jgi:hypothetical protein